MSKSHYLMLTVIAGLTGVCIWQATQLGDLRNANSTLTTQLRTIASGRRPSGPDFPGASKKPDGQPDATFASKNTATEEDPAAAAAEKERLAREARFKEMRALDRTQRADAKILALKTKLNLTPEQEKLIRDAMAKASGDRDALREAGDARRRANGDKPDSEEVRKAEMAKFAATEAAQEAAITAAMSPEQLTAYEDYKTEQKANQVEARANQQLNELQNKLALTAEQKDAAFQFYAQQEQSGFDPGQIMAQGGDVQKAFEERQKATLEGMQSILTPEQYELYSKQEEERATMFRNNGGFGGFGRGPGGPPPPPR
ncbi:MAG: hypothetical protein JWL81_809 [Verrucomicrobiales bacterium]|nr:hypothetical protein [Verrucomicrobiales bacterium]